MSGGLPPKGHSLSALVIAAVAGAFALQGNSIAAAQLSNFQMKHAIRSSPVRHFRQVNSDRFPRPVLARDFCSNLGPSCLRSVRARVWAGDVNGDGVDEFVLQAGPLELGSAGMGFHLYQRLENEWRAIATGFYDDEDLNEDWISGWFTDRPRLEILPISRNGYRDLRVSVDLCLKWSGEKYVRYEDDDYRQLLPSWFDDADPYEAEIFWRIHYAGAKLIRIEPQWFPLHTSNVSQPLWSRKEPGRADFYIDFSRLDRPLRSLTDTEMNLRWVSLRRAGVWGVEGDRGFLLVPRTSYLGSCSLAFDGDWVGGSEGCGEFDMKNEADFRYNRRTRELQWSPRTSEELTH